MNIGFVGLGHMGRAIATNLLNGGHDVRVWNRSTASIDALVCIGAQRASTVEHAFEADIVFSMLADDQALRSVLLDNAVIDRLVPGQIHINMATMSVEFANELRAAHEARQVAYIAAPVLGRPDVAALGLLNILAAGPTQALNQVQPLFDLIGKKTWRLGEDPSKANIMKLAVNFMLVSAIETMGEAAALVEAHGLEASGLIELISSSVFPGPVYEGYGKSIAEKRFEPASFKAALGLKDVRLAMAAAEGVRLPMPVAGVLHDSLTDAIDHGEGDQDLAVLGRVAARRGE